MSDSSNIKNVLYTLKVIQALGEKTRLEILRLLLEAEPNGLTAKELAALVNKKIPTILHHLEILAEAGCIYHELKPHREYKREVKHWRVIQNNITLNIDLKILAWMSKSFDDYIDEFLTTRYRLAGKRITFEDLNKITPEDFVNTLHVSQDFAHILKEYLSYEKILDILADEIHNEFIEAYEGHGVQLQMTQAEIANYLKCDLSIANEILNKLLQREDASYEMKYLPELQTFVLCLRDY